MRAENRRGKAEETGRIKESVANLDVLDQARKIGLRVPLLSREGRSPELGVCLDLHWEGLLVADVHVENVQLRVGKAVDGRADRRERLEVARKVDHQAPVRKPRL